MKDIFLEMTEKFTFEVGKQIKKTLELCLLELDKKGLKNVQLFKDIEMLLNFISTAEMWNEKIKNEKVTRINKLLAIPEFKSLLIKIHKIPKIEFFVSPEVFDTDLSDIDLLPENVVTPKKKDEAKGPPKKPRKRPAPRRKPADSVKKNIDEFFNKKTLPKKSRKTQKESTPTESENKENKSKETEAEVQKRQWKSLFAKQSEVWKKKQPEKEMEKLPDDVAEKQSEKVAVEKSEVVYVISSEEEEDELRLFLNDVKLDEMMREGVNFQAGCSKDDPAKFLPKEKSSLDEASKVVFEEITEDDFCAKYFAGFHEEMNQFFSPL